MTFNFSSQVHIGTKTVGQGQPTYIIAEAGVNHNGDIAMATALIDVAVAAGADAVKFQLFRTEELILQDVEKAGYQLEGDQDQQTQFQMLKQLEISAAQCRTLQQYAVTCGIEFLVTPFDETSLQQLAALQLSAMKISSTDLTNLPFLQQAAGLGIPLILSTGMSEWSEVEKALQSIAELCPDLVLLQCTSSYPAPDAQLNLRVIAEYQRRFGVLAGYSDHTVGIGAAPFAVAAGAVMVEKHFTLDKNLPGPDHQASLDPAELTAFVRQIRQVDSMMGSSSKGVELCELQNRSSLQKSLVARQDIRAGEVLGYHNLVAKRTGGRGIPAIYIDKLVGQPAVAEFRQSEIIYV